jgi:hypothetical protein
VSLFTKLMIIIILEKIWLKNVGRTASPAYGDYPR